MRADRHYTAYRPSESRADDRVFRRPLSHAAKTAVAKQFYYVYDNEHRAGVAQSVEQRIRNAKVGGSIPFSGISISFIRSKLSVVWCKLGANRKIAA